MPDGTTAGRTHLDAPRDARVARYDPDPWAVRYPTFHYEPSGELTIPLVSIRVSHNPMVPIALGWAYDQAVARAGAADLAGALTEP